MASITPPRVSSTPNANEVDNPTPMERQVFGDRKFYRVNINVPNLNSSGGSWVIRFAPLKDDQEKGEVSSPVATRMADPGYPLELMRHNAQGTVTLYAVIHSDGSVSDVKVLQSVDDRLDPYAGCGFCQMEVPSGNARWKSRGAGDGGGDSLLNPPVGRSRISRNVRAAGVWLQRPRPARFLWSFVMVV